MIECGDGHAKDQSRWSPGVNVGVGLDLSDNCYLIRHKKDWLLWDTGIADAVADRPEGVTSEASGTTWKRPGKLVDSLAKLGVCPSDVHWVAISHSYPDHIGNVELFPGSTLLVQTAEYNWPNADGSARFLPTHRVKKLDGNTDVFGDSSVEILSTLGDTPGHQSLLVHLRNTGCVVQSVDAAHLQDNWNNRRVPSMNVDAAATRAPLEKISETLDREHGELWINHDKPQSVGKSTRRPATTSLAGVLAFWRFGVLAVAAPMDPRGRAQDGRA